MFIGYSKNEEISFMITIVTVVKKSIMGYEFLSAQSNISLSLNYSLNSLSTFTAPVLMKLYHTDVMFTLSWSSSSIVNVPLIGQ